jgi:Family of unknown function (DUF5397)
MSPSSAATLRLPSPQAMVGQFRRLGPFGPVYKILAARVDDAGEASLHVRVVESGEVFDRRYDLTLRDPMEE